MANLNVTLKNLLQNLTYQYAMASKQNASNVKSSAKKTTATTTKKTTTNKTAKTTTVTNQKTNSNVLNIGGDKSSQTSAISNNTTITNDMVLEFFKSYKNAITTSIYNKLNNGSAMTEKDLTNFKNQVSKLSADEQKLWKTEISKIEAQIEGRISGKTVNNNTSSNTNSTNTSTLNGFVNNVLYKNGQKFSGLYTDGKYYQNGLAASGTYNGKVYVNGEAYTGTKSGIYYQNGVAYTGTVNGVKYVNGIVQTNTNNNTNTNTNTQTSTNSGVATVVSKTKKSNGDVIGYDNRGNVVYLEKTVNGKKVVYDDELSYLNANTKNYLMNVDEAVLNDRLLSDIDIVKNAEAAASKAGAKGTTAYQNAYDASIKSQMIKTTSNMKGVAGEVVEKNGSLYVNDGKGMVKLNISAETYLKLFPPVDRYDVNQYNIGNCYFVSGCLTDMLRNDEAYANLLQMFSEDSNGNVTVKFSGTLKDYPVTFTNKQLKVIDGKVNGASVKKYTNAAGSLGTQMLEQAYAIAKFSEESKKSVSTIDIDEATASISKGGWQADVYKEVLGIKSNQKYLTKNNYESYLNSVASKVNNGDMMLSFASYQEIKDYNLSKGHAYSIEKIDTINKVVYITNPWYNGGSTAVPFSVFGNIADDDYHYIFFSEGHINS